jgi:hypothetical protein
MSRTLTARERRTLRIGGTLAVPALLALFWIHGVRPYRAAVADAREAVIAQRDLLARELALLEDAERYPAAYRTADSALLRTAPRLFDETDDVLATARLTSYVAGQALGSRVLLQGAEAQPTQRTREGIRRLQVEITAESDLEGMLRFLNSLERGAKLIVVDAMSLTREERTLMKGKPPMAVLVLHATVSGFALAESPGPREAGTTAMARGPQ